MDFQRILLIGASVLVVFLLLTRWEEFKEQHQVQQIIQQQAISADMPAVAETSVPSVEINNDVPEVKISKSSDDISTLAIHDKQDTILVETDVLKLNISLKGGDIVYAALPKFSAHIDTPDIPFVLLENQQRLYIAQSGLIGPNGTDTKDGRPVFSSQYNSYRLNDNQQELIVDLPLKTEQNVEITKRFRLRKGDYLIDVDYLINNQSQQEFKVNLYGQIKRDSSPDPATSSGGSMGVQPFLGAATSTKEARFEKFDFDDMQEKPFSNQRNDGWIAMVQHYFLSAWIPSKNQTYSYSTVVTQNGQNIARFTGPQVTIAAGSTDQLSARFYMGPKDQYRLEKIADGLDLSVDYGWLWWIAQPLFALLTFFHSWTHNWGWAIILLTISVKVAFFYPSAMSYKSMARMRKVQPKMLAIRERWPDDRQKQSQEMMQLYKTEKVNPMGGCLPIVIQMPVFIALYWVLLESFELRHAPFFGYIKDLSAMDPYFILPLVMGVSMFFQQKLNPPPPDPTQAKVMQWLPVIFTFFFLWFPSGLVLYWVVNNLLSIAQQWFITRQIEAGEN